MNSTPNQEQVITAIVVEDVEIAREGLVALLKAYPQIHILGQAGTVAEALALIEKLKPELLFLDIHLPGQSAFDLLVQVDYAPKLIFTTAYSDYALKTFDFNTIDYLLKPITRARLKSAIDKLSALNQMPTAADTEAIPAEKGNEDLPSVERASDAEQLLMDSRLVIRDNDENHMVALSDIALLESCKNHTRVYFDESKPFVHKALSHIEARIPSKHFFRINRNQIVNLQKITQVRGNHNSGYELSLSPALNVTVSRRQSIVLKDILSF
ncbi:MAG: two-component system response regulator [Alteromonadaceae bacterium]|nr:MAG: two-component system response regulator [Alteromonadaceae bacterium]